MRKSRGKDASQRVPKRRPIQKRTTSPTKLPSQQTTISVTRFNAPECATYPPNSTSRRLCDVANANIKLKKKPSEYVNQLYFDAMVFSGEGLRHLVAQVGASQLMLGTDHPIPWETHPVDHVMGTPISDKDKAAILGLNAAKLFGMKTNGMG